MLQVLAPFTALLSLTNRLKMGRDASVYGNRNSS